MRILFPALPLALGCLLSTAATAQTADSTTTSPNPKAITPSQCAGTLIKVGTGLTRGLYGTYWGLSLPGVVGVEHQLSSAFSVYGNGFAGFKIGRRPRYADGYRTSLIGDYGFDLGVKYYYNQAKRRQKNKATGPYIGNYVALQTTSVFNQQPYRTYQYSTLTLTWGMQRRLGKYGWLDAYVGAGLGREPRTSYYSYTPISGQTFYTTQPASWFIAPEIGIKLSLGKALQ